MLRRVQTPAEGLGQRLRAPAGKLTAVFSCPFSLCHPGRLPDHPRLSFLIYKKRIIIMPVTV